MTKKQIRVLAGGAVFQCALIGILYNSSGTLLAQIRTEMGFSMSRISAFNTVRSVAGAVLATIFIKLFFKCSKKKYLAAVINGLVVSYMMIVIGSNTVLWYLAPLLSCTIGSVGVIAVPYIMEPWFPENFGFASGFVMAFSGVGGTVFNPLTAALIGSIGWRKTILVLCGLTILFAAVGMYLIFPEKFPQTEGQEKKAAKKADKKDRKGSLCINNIKRDKLFLLCQLCMLAGAICTQLVVYISLYAQSVGYSLVMGASLTSTAMLGNIFGKLFYGTVCDKIGNWKSTALVCGIVSAGVFSMIIFSSSFPVLCIAAFLFGFTFSCSTLVVSQCCMGAYGVQESEKYVGIHASVNGAVGAVCMMLAGVLYDVTGNFVLIFGIGGTAAIISAAAALRVENVKRN